MHNPTYLEGLLGILLIRIEYRLIMLDVVSTTQQNSNAKGNWKGKMVHPPKKILYEIFTYATINGIWWL